MAESPTIIGFGHQSGVGKDHLAQALRRFSVETPEGRRVGFLREAFADRLKCLAFQVFGWAGLNHGTYYDNHREERYIKLPRLGLTPQEVWIEVGNRMRDIHPDVWVQRLLHERDDAGRRYSIPMITDVRFPNEVEAIKQAGGVVVRVTREGYTPPSTPSDDVLLDFEGWDATFINSGRWDYAYTMAVRDLLIRLNFQGVCSLD
jgi:hypothetical protein